MANQASTPEPSPKPSLKAPTPRGRRLAPPCPHPRAKPFPCLPSRTHLLPQRSDPSPRSCPPLSLRPWLPALSTPCTPSSPSQGRLTPRWCRGCSPAPRAGVTALLVVRTTQNTYTSCALPSSLLLCYVVHLLLCYIVTPLLSRAPLYEFSSTHYGNQI